jgi:protein-tyrosine phosphatase
MTLTGVRNFRDLGGCQTRDQRRVRTGRVFRSGHLGRATDADLDTLARLGIRVVIDLRGPHEVEADGEDRLPVGAGLVSIPMFDLGGGNDIRTLLFSTPPERIADVFGDGRAADAMTRAAAGFVTDESYGPLFARVLRTVIDADGPVVVHCAAGKDRTGWAATMMLLLLDVPDTTVIDHYLLSNRRRPEVHPHVAGLAAAGVDVSVLEPLAEVRAEYKRAALDALSERWGGIAGYAHSALGASEDDVARFRRLLLADPA